MEDFCVLRIVRVLVRMAFEGFLAVGLSNGGLVGLEVDLEKFVQV
jgi:hypothetical protein